MAKLTSDKKENLILKLLSKGESIIIDACDGTQILGTDKKTFKSGIYNHFKDWGINKPGIATKEQAVDVHELVKDGTFAQMFGSLGTDLGKLCLTQHQIKTFCEVHKEGWLRKGGYVTYFLLRVDEQFFVVGVYERSVVLDAYVRGFGLGGVWFAGNGYRVVVPRQMGEQAQLTA